MTTLDRTRTSVPATQTAKTGRFYNLSAQVARPLVLLVFLGVWEGLGRAGVLDAFAFSRPSMVWDALVTYSQGELYTQLIATLMAVGVSLLIGIPAGIAAGFLLAAVPWLDRVVGVYMAPINSMPRLALVPVFMIWFGITTTTKVAVAVSIIFFMLLFTARAGVKGIEPDQTLVARSLGMGRRELYLKVVLPGSVPTIFAGIRLSVTYALLGVIATEMIAARDGLGVDIVRFGQTLEVSGVFAILLVLMILASLLDLLLGSFEKWLLRWQ
jgi:NitT/TauT family transport system permease protein